jgi:hypothetical protein
MGASGNTIALEACVWSPPALADRLAPARRTARASCLALPPLVPLRPAGSGLCLLFPP